MYIPDSIFNFDVFMNIFFILVNKNKQRSMNIKSTCYRVFDLIFNYNIFMNIFFK